MALFGSKKKTEAVATEKKVAVPKKVSSMKRDFSAVLIRPRITEKASMQAEHNAYIFEVSTTASKKDIALAVESYYKVAPIKVRTVTIPAKTVFVRGHRGVKAGSKKAYVFLKKGDKLEIA